MGHGDTKYVTLEEQLAIFLYTSVTGLFIRHVEERFQRANGTISKWVFQSLVMIIYANQIIDTFEKWLSYSHLNLFMANMFEVQPAMILSLPGFVITANYGLFSKDALEPLMVAIYPSLHLLPSKVSIVIEKAFFHRIVFSYVTLTCSSHIFLQAGKVLQQILGSGLMHWQEGFQHLKDFIILQMQDFLIARNFLSLSMVFGIISRSGVLQVFGMCLSDINLIYLIFFINSPTNAKELFNLRHAQARNVIECIFGVLKQWFRILLLPPHYQLDFQARIPVALCALQNFIQEIDHNEGVIPTDPYQAAHAPFPSDIVIAMVMGLLELYGRCRN